MKRVVSTLLVVLLCFGATRGRAEGIFGFISGLLSGEREFTVGEDISFDDIREFYWTYDASSYPPDFQRYRLYVEDGARFFYHETRKGDHWPLGPDDVTASGTTALTEEQWTRFCGCLAGGTVRGREEDVTTGDAGPWMFLYWDGDKGRYQVFDFADFEKKAAFEALCAELASDDASDEEEGGAAP